MLEKTSTFSLGGAAALFAFAAASLGFIPAAAAQSGEAPTLNADAGEANAQSPDPASQAPSEAAAHVIDWVVRSSDNNGLPFIVLDKVRAELFVFDASGQPLGRAPVLIGAARGDVSAPGVDNRQLSKIPVEERTTPAGRFVAKYGPARGYKATLWVDYGSAVSLHPVVTSNPAEKRLARLQSTTPEDNRITFGCINLPKAFYSTVVQPQFRQTGGIVYILPEERPLTEVFVSIAARNVAPILSMSSQ